MLTFVFFTVDYQERLIKVIKAKTGKSNLVNCVDIHVLSYQNSYCEVVRTFEIIKNTNKMDLL